MGNHSILIYGAGNCEIAGALEYELNQITQINKPNIKIFARGYFFNNSCIAMYRRFKQIKEYVKEISRGGVHEYFYNGDETIKTCELKVNSTSEITFEKFLKDGIEKLQADEVILILIGQGNYGGMFMDFSKSPPIYIPYEKVFSIIEHCVKGKVKRLSIILDVSQWHNIYMPLYIAQYSFIDTVFVYERDAYLSIFPVYKWIDKALEGQEHWIASTTALFNGYHIDSHPIWWELCSHKWEEYVRFPSGKSFEAFYSIYKKVVIHKGNSMRIYSKELRDQGIAYHNQLSLKDTKAYFSREYLCDIEQNDVEKWLNALKICADYYK
ncbi:hypothetical protein [Cellulosilyticum sp. I15G10I2]|uniref:hypothetical protein n=1 Tax=Cellulosilyticum sp. I15G10I2 TaxID=1892843 RepID=UPI00085C81DC|nr:hypothetical protein [Cellulosilyticum sp. I15G10I2]